VLHDDGNFVTLANALDPVVVTMTIVRGCTVTDRKDYVVKVNFLFTEIVSVILVTVNVVEAT
jgi:hypothetical protein